MNNIDRESASYEDQYSGPREEFVESRGGRSHSNRVMLAPNSY